MPTFFKPAIVRFTLFAVAIITLGMLAINCGNIEAEAGTAEFRILLAEKEITLVTVELIKDTKVVTVNLPADNSTGIAQGVISDLEEGDWDVKADAKNADGVVKFSGTGTVTITAGKIAGLKINLTAVAQVGSLNITVTFTGSGSEPSTSGQIYALICGVGDYPGDMFDLIGPPFDVENMKQVLEMDNTQNVRVTTKLNAEATKIGIKSAVDDLRAKLKPGDDVIFYFSGHGCQGGGTNFEDESVVTYDALDSEGTLYSENLLSDNDLESWLATFPTKDILFIFDTCYSGGMVKPRAWIYEKKTFMIANPIGMAKDLNQVGYTVMMASDKTEYSLDTNTGGLYTYFLVDGLKTRAADANEDHLIKPRELHDYAAPEVTSQSAEWGYSQHPQLFIGCQAEEITILKY